MPSVSIAGRCSRLLLLLLLVPASLLAQPVAKFQAGMTAYQAGDYVAAAEAFEQARSAGLERPALDYNLGSTYYRLGDYQRAREAFDRLLAVPAMAPLAHYNLGLVYRRQGRPAEAHYHFQTAWQASDDQRLRYLARRQIATETEVEPKPGYDWRAYANVALGYDDNVDFVPTDVPTYRGDEFLETYVSGSGVLQGTRSDGFSLHGSLYDLRYRDTGQSDFTELWLLARRNVQLGDWQTYAGGFALRDNLAGDGYQRALGLETGARRELKQDHYVDLRYIYEDIDSLDGRYDYLEGDRHELRAEYAAYQARDSLRFAYALELNDRRDTALESYSPTRHSLHAYYTYDVNADWRLRADASYRRSDYPSAPSLDRTDTRWRTRLSASHALSKDWRLRGQWEYTDNRSNDPLRDYERQVYSLQLEWLY